MGIRRLFRPHPQHGKRFRLFYASDVHGCDVAWRKFLAAPRYYQAEALVMGGDLTGKALVPIVHEDEGSWHTYLNGERSLETIDEVESHEQSLAVNGFYPYRCDAAEHRRLETDPDHLAEVFRQVIADRVREWVALAEQRLAGTGVELWVMPGNDDDPVVDSLLTGNVVHNCDGSVVEVGDYLMASIGWANPTPWHTPREEPEERLAERIERLVDGHDPTRLIFNFHVPPYGTSLDVGPAVRADLSVEKEAGDVKRVPIGSTAVREAIERYQPLLAVHGHVHESPAIERIGRTLCVNPGSRYNEGVLDGVLVTLAADEVASCQLVSG